MSVPRMPEQQVSLFWSDDCDFITLAAELASCCQQYFSDSILLSIFMADSSQYQNLSLAKWQFLTEADWILGQSQKVDTVLIWLPV